VAVAVMTAVMVVTVVMRLVIMAMRPVRAHARLSCWRMSAITAS
jgi:hypothetical protein